MAALNWETLLCLGDSITIGSRSYLGYPEYCGDLLTKTLGKQWNVINHATAGHTTADLLRSLHLDWMSYKAMFPGLVTLMIGTNDVKNKVPAHRVRAAYEQVVLKARLMSVSNHVLLIQIPTFPPKLLYPYTFSMNDQVAEHNQMVADMAHQHGLRTFAFQLEEDDFFDGVHFTESGSEKAGRQLADLILRDKGYAHPSDQ
jgi:lysophospholipase L1-like esterase